MKTVLLSAVLLSFVSLARAADAPKAPAGNDVSKMSCADLEKAAATAKAFHKVILQSEMAKKKCKVEKPVAEQKPAPATTPERKPANPAPSHETQHVSKEKECMDLAAKIKAAKHPLSRIQLEQRYKLAGCDKLPKKP